MRLDGRVVNMILGALHLTQYIGGKETAVSIMMEGNRAELEGNSITIRRLLPYLSM